MLDFLNDAQAAVGFVESQTSHIEREVNEVERPEIQYQRFVPIDNSANEWIKTVTYYSSDKFGKAKWVNGNADDIPLAGTERSKFETDVHTAAIGYGFSLEELMQAQMLGQNLQADDADASRRAYEEFCDELGLFGDVEKGYEGLLNSSTVTAASAVTGAWATATEDQILEDINTSIRGVANATGYTSMANTLLLPYDKMDFLASNRLGDTQMTILAFLKLNNSYTAMSGRPLEIAAVRRLETAGVGSVNRMMAYNKNPKVVKMHIPMPHKFLRPREMGVMSIVVPGIFRVGGVDWRRPLEARYTDGI